MARIAVMSDIHANAPALEAVWRDIGRQKLDAVYHLGDLVGYNPHPAEVIEFIKDNQVPGISGNYDLAVAGGEPDPVSVYLKEKISPAGVAAWEWTRARVSTPDRDYLKNLPQRLDLEIEGARLTLVHGSPESIREYLRPDIPDDRLNRLTFLTGSDALLCGHTHIPMIRRVESGLVLNPGSVGKPKDGDPRAGYLLLDIEKGRLTPELRRVEYPVSQVAEAIRASGLPKVQADSLEKGLSA
ncbi:MAG: metallophosphoesterase family protein [Pseudomonadota bacterium]